jgi:tRNA uridine 5-carbamoylmethylation protein Kti12
VTTSVSRFRVALPAKKVTTLLVDEEWIRSETIALIGTDIGTLLQYSRTGEISQPVRDAIAKAAQLNQTALDADRQANTRTQQINDLSAEQTRIRENMKTVSATSEYYQRLLAKLNEQESTIEKLQRERADFIQKRDAARRELADYLNGLTVG